MSDNNGDLPSLDTNKGNGASQSRLSIPKEGLKEIKQRGFRIGTPLELKTQLEDVGYMAGDFICVQMALVLNTPSKKVRTLLLEGPSGCGKSFLAQSLCKITGAKFMQLSCYAGMNTQDLIESQSLVGVSKAMAGMTVTEKDLVNHGIITRSFVSSRERPTILLIDELDKAHESIDTFFLGPIQDGKMFLDSQDEPIECDIENLLIVFTKNMNRVIDQALLRRCHPVRMTYLDSTLEKKILSPHCHAQLVSNLVDIADRMRNSQGSYTFERPPAPEELLSCGHYVMKMMQWGITDFSFIGRNLWAMIAKSEHDRAVFEHMMRFHPDFLDPLVPDARYLPIGDIHKRFGRLMLQGIVPDPEEESRKKAEAAMGYN